MLTGRLSAHVPDAGRRAAAASTEEKLSVRRAATVVCARQRIPRQPLVLKLSDVNSGEEDESDKHKNDKRTLHVFGVDKTEREFSHGWEFLMGQGEVQNFLRSSKDKTVHMRYGGEYKFAGGRLEAGETPLEAARRELEEEFMLMLPESTTLRLFHIRQTRPVQNTSFIMYSFLCLESENPWLADPNLSQVINKRLQDRRVEFQSVMESGLFQKLTEKEKESCCPEVRRVDWLDMREAISHSYSSMNNTLTCVNEWQRSEFERLGIDSRDPLFVTMAVMTDLDKYATDLEAIEATRQFDGAVAEREAVWLDEGMSGEDLRSALASRGTTAAGNLKDPAEGATSEITAPGKL